MTAQESFLRNFLKIISLYAMQQCKECLKTEYLKRSLKTENDIIHRTSQAKET